MLVPPCNYTEIRRFLGTTRFFRHFIKNYARIAGPLNDLLEGEASNWKTQPVDLPPEAKEAFNILKTKCVTALVLAFTDFEKPFLLETDASSCGLGAVLSQKQDDGKFHLVAYASRELKGGEKKYHSSKLKFLALKWAVTDQFREYLQYRPFTVRTDNNPLTYIMTTPNLDATGHRWVVAMTGYDMTIEYLKGTDNKVADMMSWVPEQLDPEMVTVLLSHARNSDVLRAETDDPRLMEEHQRINEDVVLWPHQLVKQDKRFRNLMNWNWVLSQMNDPVLRYVVEWIRCPRANTNTLDEFMQTRGVLEVDRRYYAQRQKDFILKDDLLFLNITQSNSMEKISVFIVPAHKQQAAIDGCHRSHDRTLSLMKERFWWPRMTRALVMAVSNCGQCKQFEAKPQIPGMQPIICTEPMELVHVDYVGMEVTVSTQEKPVVKNVLVVVNHFTQYVQAYVTQNQTARTTTRVLYNEYFSVFGFPQKLMSDQGTGFTSKVITAICSLLGTEKIQTTLCHPQSNGSAERVHQTLRRMIGKLDLEKCQKWPVHLGSVLIAYNATRSLVMGYFPYYLMFGRRPRLPIELLFPTRREQNLTRTIDKYVETLYRHLRKSVKMAQDSALKEALWQKRLYDRKVGAVELRPGDHVLVKLDAFRSQWRKLKNRWGSDLHTVKTRMADGIPAYVVKNERTGKTQVLHRSKLLLWLTNYVEPLQMNCMCVSVTLQEIPENPLPGSEDGGPVPGCVTFGLNLAKLWIIVDTSESVTHQVACKMRMGALRNGTGLRIELRTEEDPDPECLGSLTGDVPCS